MATSKRIRNTGHGTPVALVTGVQNPQRAGETIGVNYGTADVKGRLKTRVITLLGFDGTDSFKILVKFRSQERIDQLTAGKVSSTAETAAIVRGTNATAAAIQSELRTATGDSSLTVAGTTDEGPFTITQGDVASAHRQGFEFALTTLSGCAGTVSSGAATFVDATGKASTANQTASAVGRGAGLDVPLGYSIVTRGVGETAQTTLVPITVDTAPGGDDQVVIAGTEVASAGTSGEALYSIFKTRTDVPHSVVATEDADGDVTITGLDSAVDYYFVPYSVAKEGSSDFAAQRERVSRPGDAVYFTTT